MSLYLVGPEHISLLLWAGHERFHRPGHNLSWSFDNPIRVHQLIDDNLTAVGQMLVDANNASVNAGYDEDLQAYEDRYSRPRLSAWSLVEVAKALQCYEYQTSELPDWPASEAYAFCRSLQHQLVQALPGYDHAPWGITASTRPAATPHAS
jgi:hypothetical protein